MEIFYLNCPLGFEELLIKELRYKWGHYFPKQPIEILKTDKGGVEISCELAYGLALNNILKIPSRIILRIKSQKCRDLPKLFNILKKINWKHHLQQYNIEFSVSAGQSRLIHTGRIEKTAREALDFYFKANKIPEKKLLTNSPDQIIYLRFFNDQLDISLDTSGELLHRRGMDYRGKASIRETYSAALLLALLDLKEYHKFRLIDPMCGSATFLTEAQSFFKINNRKFAYENWASYEKVTLPELDSLWNFNHYLGNEIDPTVTKNLNFPDIEITEGDFFKFNYTDANILILNPPYGKRVKIQGEKTAYFASLIEHIKTKIRPTKFGIIIPEQFSKGIRASRKLAFNQNGIKVIFHIFE